MSKGLASIGTEIPIEVVQINAEGSTDTAAPEGDSGLKKGDRLNLIVQHHAKLTSEVPDQSTPAIGFIVARRNECLITFPHPAQLQSQVTGYRTTTPAAYFASLYYDLRGGFLLLGHAEAEHTDAEHTDAEHADAENGRIPTSRPLPDKPANKHLQDNPISSSSMLYLLLDSRWCTWFKVHEGITLASDTLPDTDTGE